MACIKICELIYEEDKNLLGIEKSITPKYFYSTKEKSCYYSGGIDFYEFIGENIVNISHRHVKNCSTGKRLLYFSTSKHDKNYDNCTVAKDCAYSLEEYKKKKVSYLATNKKFLKIVI